MRGHQLYYSGQYASVSSSAWPLSPSRPSDAGSGKISSLLAMQVKQGKFVHAFHQVYMPEIKNKVA